MRLALLAILPVLLLALSPRPVARAQTSPVHAVTWDSHSLLIDGSRILLYSGEFHYWRLPSPGLWEDRLEKMRAAGLNAVSIYFDWQYHSPAPGQYDFTGVRDIDRLLDITDRLGLYVIARVGPYMNGEADAGGLPGWLLRQPQLFPRSQSWNGVSTQAQYSPLYAQYSREWYDHLLPILARHEVTSGGSVLLLSIENEYSQVEGSQQYMQDLYRFARDDGISVPIFHNDFYFRGDWDGLVDLYAFDSYPYGFDCCHQWWDSHFHGIDSWESTVRTQLKITTPMFVSELQGGSFDPWGGKGYDAIARTFGPDWFSAIDQSALAQGTSILNTYMFVGGTSWGYMSEPGVYTSYDYGAPIAESGALRPAYYSAHRLGMFLQAYGSRLAGADAAPSAAIASNQSVVVHSRADAGSGQVFTFLRHGDAGPPVTTRLAIPLAGQYVSVPQKKGTFITVPGHGAELLTQNVDVGPLHMNYSTSQVLTDASTAQGHYLVLYGPASSDGETDFVLPQGQVDVAHNAGVEVSRLGGELRLDYRHQANPTTVQITTAQGALRLLIVDTAQASRVWLDNGLLISGPDLVTDVDGQLKLHMSRQRGARVYGAPADRTLAVDGAQTALPDPLMGSVLLGGLEGAPTLVLPALDTWRFEPEAPETAPEFDDSGWIVADHTTTANPNVPSTSTLLADDYGFHYGFVWYRGHFSATGGESGISLSARQSYSLFLNGTYLGSDDSPMGDPPHVYSTFRSFAFPPGVLRAGQDNVISVLVESLGHDEGWTAGPLAQSPQGILGAQLNDAPTPIVWKIQGDQGGETPADAARGLFNASGLFGERNGWYLPGFDDAGWQAVSPPDDWKARSVTAAIGWYRTHFSLNIPAGVQTPIGITLPQVSDKALIWVNGWLIGRYWQQKGPQHTFFVPAGILNEHGDNVVAIAVWNRGDDGGLSARPVLTQYPSLAWHSLSLRQTSTLQKPDYWHTEGNRIVDSSGSPVRIAAVNWSGMQGTSFVPAGLDRQSLDAIVARIAALGFNAIRLPFSDEMVESNPVITERVGANPDLKGLHALDILDRLVAAAGQHGLRVILDNHRSTAGVDPQDNGLWYTGKYPEAGWIADWQLLARRYLGNATVIGADLRDEPHTAPPGPWSVKTYMRQGATWGPYKGVENASTDWRLAAERGGNAVLSVNPRLLIFVEGLQQYPDPTQPGGLDSYWWGGILQPAARYPVELSVPRQLVYSPHEYGPLKYQMPFFGPHMSYQEMSAVWEKHWGFLEKAGSALQTPIFIGEFGTCGTGNGCVDDSAPGSQGLWFQIMMEYLRRHPEIGWSYWALNGTNGLGKVQPNYVLKGDWKTLRLQRLIQTLRDIEVPSPPNR